MMRIVRASAALLLAAALLYALQHTRPLYSNITSPIVADGSLGERVSTSSFALTLDRVRAARVLDVETFGDVKHFTSSGVWVLAEGSAEAGNQTTSLTSGEWLSHAGIRYHLTDRLPPTIAQMPGDVYQPGLPRPTLLIFEVSEDAIAGGTVVVSRSKLMPLDDEARIEIGKAPIAIEPAITIQRDEQGRPWTLLPPK